MKVVDTSMVHKRTNFRRKKNEQGKATELCMAKTNNCSINGMLSMYSVSMHLNPLRAVCSERNQHFSIEACKKGKNLRR